MNQQEQNRQVIRRAVVRQMRDALVWAERNRVPCTDPDCTRCKQPVYSQPPLRHAYSPNLSMADRRFAMDEAERADQPYRPLPAYLRFVDPHAPDTNRTAVVRAIESGINPEHIVGTQHTEPQSKGWWPFNR